MRLNLPEYKFNIKKNESDLVIFDQLRKRFVALTPEEWVRQNFVQFLISERDFPAALMGNEVSLVQNGIKPYFEERFTDLALNCGKKRDLALEEFNREKKIAVKKYQDDHDPEVLAQREKERLGNLLSIGKMKNVFQAEKKKYATSLIFSCDVVELSTNTPRIATVSISVMDGEIIEQKIGFVNTDNGYENKEKNIQPEELPQILNLIETGLSDAQKNALGKDFFDTVYKQGGIQTANNPVKLNPALIAAATKGNNK